MPSDSLDEQAELTNDAIEGIIDVPPSAPRLGTFAALSHRNFRLYFIGLFISVAGSWMQIVAQQWLVYKLTHSSEWLGIVSGAAAIPYVLLSMHGGHVADTYPRRNTMLWTQTVFMVLAFALAILDTRFSPVHIQAWHIAVISALSSVVNAYAMPAQQAFLSDMVDTREMLGNAIALGSIQFNTARILGPVLAGIVLAEYGAAACFFVNALSFIAVIISLIMMRLRPFVPASRKISVWEGFHFIWKNTRMLRVVILMSAGSMFLWSVSTLNPVFADRMVPGLYGMKITHQVFNQMSARLLGWLTAATGIGAALGGLFIASDADRFPRRVMLYGAALGFALGLATFALAGNYILILLLLAVASLFMVIFAVTCNTMVQSEVTDELRGRVMAVYSLLFGGLFPVGGLEIGFLADKIGATGAVMVNTGIFIVVELFTFIWYLTETARKTVE